MHEWCNHQCRSTCRWSELPAPLAARVEFLCAYRNFRPQTKLAAVGKTRRGVNVNSGGIHFVDKTLGITHIAGQDRIGVLRTVFTNMGDGIVKSR